MTDPISGFSKLTKEEKIEWLRKTYLADSPKATQILKQYWNPDADLQQLHEEFTENTLFQLLFTFWLSTKFSH